jgi:hypothetical protein
VRLLGLSALWLAALAMTAALWLEGFEFVVGLVVGASLLIVAFRMALRRA